MDFRVLFARMDSAAWIDTRELALLLCTSEKNIVVMKSRGQLPPTVFPSRRVNRWLVGTVRTWLRQAGEPAAQDDQEFIRPAERVTGGPALPANVRRIGRPRKPVEAV